LSWFTDLPERLEYELQALTACGFSYVLDEGRRLAGQIVLKVTVPVRGEDHTFTVVFPSSYPYFPFQVFAPTLKLERHQDPYSGLLCFVAQIYTEWDANDTVASYLTTRLSDVLRANGEAGTVREAREGAPVTGQMTFGDNTVVMTGNWELPLNCVQGALTLGLERGSDPNSVLRGAVLEVTGGDAEVFGSADDHIAARYPERLVGRWVRIADKPRSNSASDLIEQAASVAADIRRPMFKGGPDIVGLVFRDEARFNEMHDLWVFIVRRRNRVISRDRKHRKIPGDSISSYLARADRGARDDLYERVPRLRPLADKKCLVVGLGALGSMVAWQLARAGIGQLTLVDHDFVQAGNMPRWIAGWNVAGVNKALAVGSLIHECYPYVKTTCVRMRLGDPAPLDDRVAPNIDEQTVEEMLQGQDVVIDCTVEFTVHHFLSDTARKRNVPYIWASGTPGGWGGIVGRARPARELGCWQCFKRHQRDGRYPTPNAEDVADVQPIGCFSPTFTGAGFDMDLISIQATRLAVSTLCAGDAGGYPDFEWDVAFANLWAGGRPVAGEWITDRLERHPECLLHE